MTSSSNRIDGIAPLAPALAGFGPLPVGVQSLSLVNPGQRDVLSPDQRVYDRELTVELWYPAEYDGGLTLADSVYDTLLRDGVTPIRLHGRAIRDAARAEGDFPLVILSHGYPGNRMLMAHLGETLASRGYVVASIDHRDSTYADQSDFLSTLLNRPLDTRFVADQLAAQAYAIIGYSMGGYGALVSGGARLAEAAVRAHGEVLARYQHHEPDPRLKAILPIGPWGRQRGFWDAEGLGQMRKPMLLMAGSADAISGYQDGMRQIFSEAGGPSLLLTFEGAGHNAAAPYPAPAEAFVPSPHLPFLPVEHYADPVWDTCRMNGIAQHFAAAFLGLHLKGQRAMSAYLTSELAGFPAGSADGLRLEERG